MPNIKSKIRRGFTLIELLVVISIIAILLSIATVSYTNSQEKGRDNRRKSDLKAVQQALELYFQQNGKYPATGTGGNAGKIRCNTGVTPPTNGDNDTIDWATSFACDPDGTAGSQTDITYMNPLPKDPRTTSTQYYYNSPTTSTYILSAVIENTSDPDLPQVTGCQASYNYCVKNP